jgi:hypothetical protein
VNNNFGAPIVTTENIVVTAVNGGNDPYSGIDVIGNGFCYLDGDAIRVVYDVSRCCGEGVFNFDIAGNKISKPNPVVLYHELSQAFRAATNTQAANDEIPAETDENVLRSQLGLCLRDVNNHDGGCGSGDDCGGNDGGVDGGPPAFGCLVAGGGGGCFIVSATTGSSESIEVACLRALRDRVGGVSGLSAQLIETIYRDYYQFSPGIAAELEQSVFARQAILRIVVRPLLAWYTLAGALALSRPDAKTVKKATRGVLSACPRYLGGSSIAGLLETIQLGEPLPASAPQLLLDLAPRIREAAQLRFASWAILDPLARVWTSTMRQLDLLDEVAQWLATAPLEAVMPPGDAQLLDKELEALASFFGFRPAARRQLGKRLAEAWPDATDALERHGFIERRDQLT